MLKNLKQILIEYNKLKKMLEKQQQVNQKKSKINLYIIKFLYRKKNDEERKAQIKKELEDFENNLKNELEDKKRIVDLEQEDLQKKEEESAKELEDIKNIVELKKDSITDFIITNVMNVNMDFPEMVKKRFVKKKKGKKN